MGFIMDGLDAEAYDRQYTDGVLLRRIFTYFRGEWWRIGIIVLVIVLGSAMGTLTPIVISWAIDLLQANPTLDMMFQATFYVTLTGVLSWLFAAIRQWLQAISVGNIVLGLREDAFEAVVQRDLSFYDAFPSAKIVSRVTSDSLNFANVVNLTVELLSQVLIVAFLVGYLLTISIPLTLVLLAIAPFVVGAALAFRRIARYTITQSRRVNAVVNSHVQETIAGISVAKTFRQEQAAYDEFVAVNQRSYRINIRGGYVFSGIFPVLTMLAGIGTALLVYTGGLRAQQGALSAGDWYLFIQGMGLFWFPLTSIASFWSQFQLGLAAGERIFALIDAEPKVVQTDARDIRPIKGDIRFENVTFSYNNDKETVLRDFNLHIPAGQTLALVGHTGSGKSSIAKLIARFYEFQAGRILIDGHDIRALDLSLYHPQLGIVTQTPFLFDGTIRDNIRYGRADATDADVEAAAHAIAGGDWLRSLPQGLDTPVGERGGSLSMGQRQLVTLARVVLQNPSIFILDEATASIDPLTETLIQEGLDAILRSRTSIVIAHRLNTIKHADRIIVLRRGEIIEQGTHDALLAQGGHYAELYNTYFRHQSLDYIEHANALL
ncbi:MAG: ABC transporter ATP-binding protein/permease [Anaerolineae bacterium]|nr:ABC transporter ATP-binding protein/permease [Anaerolineae bacterium]MDW8172357.1 ABC transporter ATP-binding protein [Anaerolineae bacterium]